MITLRILIIFLSVTYCLAKTYMVEQVGWGHGRCGGGCNYLPSPSYLKPEAIQGYCPQGESCLKTTGFFLMMKLCCDDITATFQGGARARYQINWYNSVVVMYEYYVLDYFKPLDLWKNEKAKVNEGLKSSVIPFYQLRSGVDPTAVTVLYALSDKRCVKKTYRLKGAFESNDKWFDYKVFQLPERSKTEEAIPCSEFEEARQRHECLDCVLFHNTVSIE